MNQKHDDAYKSIGEVAKDLKLVNPKTGKLNTHTIRFWEKEFKQIKPKIFAGKRRYYDKKSIKIFKKIRFLLKEKGLTINGVKKLLNDKNSDSLDDSVNLGVYKPNLKTTKIVKDKIKNIYKIVKELKNFK